MSTFGVTYTIGKILANYKKDLKHAVTMPSHQGYCFTYIYGCIKFYCSKVKGSEVIWGLKKSYFT